MDRAREGRAAETLVDLRDVEALRGIRSVAGGLSIGGMVTLSELARSPLAAPWRGLTATAAAVGNPAIRTVGTVGGNLLQSPRCWYFRDPHSHCLKKGGPLCHARVGDHSRHACIDLGSCLAPHPSSLGVALLAYDASVTLAHGGTWPVERFFGDGTDPRRQNAAPTGALLVSVELPGAGEHATAHLRCTARVAGDWPDVEVVVVLSHRGGRVRQARVAAGGVATIPLRLRAVEDALVGRVPTEAVLADAAGSAARHASSPPDAAWKLRLLRGAVLVALEQAVNE